MSSTYSDLEEPRDITVWKIASEVPSTTPTAISAGGSSQRWEKLHIHIRGKIENI